MTEIYTDPVGLGYGGSFELCQETDPDRMIVRHADERIAVERRFWAHLVDVASHGALLVDGGPSFEDTDDGKELRMSVGIEDEGVGRVTYRVAKAHREWILLEKVQ